MEVDLANTASSQALHCNNHKQIIKLNIKEVQNPNLREANQLAIHKRGQGVELGTTKKQIHNAASGRSGTRTRDLRVALPLGHAAPPKQHLLIKTSEIKIKSR